MRENNKTRKLSRQEQKRAVRFEQDKARLESQGYIARDAVVGVVFANVVVLLAAIPLFSLCVFLFVWRNRTWEHSIDTRGYLLFLAGFFILIVVHELIHGLFFGLFAEHHFRAVSFGVIWKYLTPYCSCAEPLRPRQYAVALLMPTVLVGLLPLVVGIYSGSFLLTLLAATMTLAGGGDVLIWSCILRSRCTKRTYIIDHPYQCGCVLFEPSDMHQTV